MEPVFKTERMYAEACRARLDYCTYSGEASDYLRTSRQWFRGALWTSAFTLLITNTPPLDAPWMNVAWLAPAAMASYALTQRTNARDSQRRAELALLREQSFEILRGREYWAITYAISTGDDSRMGEFMYCVKRGLIPAEHAEAALEARVSALASATREDSEDADDEFQRLVYEEECKGLEDSSLEGGEEWTPYDER